ncbi:hypothetical protein B0T21DRAFT_358839 [Apiosordaria backusii]|uniref:Uncharacterized protein n=1 Tax=Apiosordaria backusii TaxID=314023 RepID=A0AA40K3X1_9PEZI|nr:hypothetical protein B0T21DRAFT_358839 [Apiosordaria backusii]
MRHERLFRFVSFLFLSPLSAFLTAAFKHLSPLLCISPSGACILTLQCAFKMHSNRATLFLSASCALISSCLSLPLNEPALQQPAALEPRATYAVVNIDGGSGTGQGGSSGGGIGAGGPGSSGGSPGGSGGSGAGNQPVPNPVTITVIQSPPTKTAVQTVFMTSPPVTNRVTDTVVVTKTVQIVNIEPETTLATSTAQPLPTSSAQPVLPVETSLLTSTPVSIPTISGVSIATPTSVLPLSTDSTLTTSIAAAPATSLSSSTEYDDGKWHTTYRAWNGTLTRRSNRSRPRLRAVF